MAIYDTEIEEREKFLILDNLPSATIIDPGSFQDNFQKQKYGMDYCYRLLEKCNALVFTKFLNKITAGVGLEINHALKMNIPVQELRGKTLKSVKKPVVFLSRTETIILYRTWRITQILKSKRRKRT